MTGYNGPYIPKKIRLYVRPSGGPRGSVLLSVKDLIHPGHGSSNGSPSDGWPAEGEGEGLERHAVAAM